MRGHQQVAFRAHAAIHRQHIQAGQNPAACHKPGFRLGQGGAVDLAPRFAGHQHIALPKLVAESRAAVHPQIEIESAGRLMLRSVVPQAGFIHHTRQVLWMPGRKAEVQPLADVQQLVERVAVGQPGGTLLVAAEQFIARPHAQRHREANPRADHLALAGIGRQSQDGSPFRIQLVRGLAILAHLMPVGKIGAPKPEVDRPVLGVHRHAQGVHIQRQFHPPLRQHLFSRFAIVVGVVQQHHLPLAGHHQALAQRVPLGQQVHADG